MSVACSTAVAAVFSLLWKWGISEHWTVATEVE